MAYVEIKYLAVDGSIAYDDLPQEALPPCMQHVNLKGVDLMAYTVQSLHLESEEAQKQAEARAGVVVLWHLDWPRGYTDGISLPANFDGSKVRFFRTERQRLQEAARSELMRAMELKTTILETIPGVLVNMTPACGGSVYISPDQETFSSSWYVLVSSYEEAREAVRRHNHTWTRWNDRALAALERRGIKRPDRGSVCLRFSDGQCHMGFKKRGEILWVDLEEDRGEGSVSL